MSVEQAPLLPGDEESGANGPPSAALGPPSSPTGYGIPLGVDIINWEAVRKAEPAEMADAIRCRGMYHMLTGVRM